MRYVKVGFWMFGGFFVLMAVIAALSDYDASRRVASAAAERDAPTRAPEPPIVEVSATDLYRAYDANAVAADQTYKGKRVRVWGTIDSIGKDILDTPYIALHVDGQVLGNVQAMFSRANTDKLAALSKGQSATVLCDVSGKMMNIVLKDCLLQR